MCMIGRNKGTGKSRDRRKGFLPSEYHNSTDDVHTVIFLS